MRVGLFIPCYVDQFYPRVGIATLQLLEIFGCEVIYPAQQTCCGQSELSRTKINQPPLRELPDLPVAQGADANLPGERILPFITKHLALVLRRSEIVANMHEAYERIAMLESALPAAAGGAAAIAPGYGFAA